MWKHSISGNFTTLSVRCEVITQENHASDYKGHSSRRDFDSIPVQYTVLYTPKVPGKVKDTAPLDNLNCLSQACHERKGSLIVVKKLVCSAVSTHI